MGVSEAGGINDKMRKMGERTCLTGIMMSSAWDHLSLKSLMVPQWGTCGWRSLMDSLKHKIVEKEHAPRSIAREGTCFRENV